MKKKLFWMLVIILILIVWLWITVHIFKENGRDYYYDDWVLTTFKQDEDLSYIVYKNFKIADWKYISNYRNGQTGAIENYVDWKPEWERLFYDETGNFRLIQNYKHWKRDWEWIAYNEEGNISSISTFKNWLLDWESIYYDENGLILQKDYFENGIKIYFDEDWNRLEWEKIIYYENWDIMSIENYKDWKQDWERIYYHGSYKDICFYNNGERENCKTILVNN